VERAVAGQQEGVSGAGRVGEGVQGLGEGDFQVAYAEQAVEGLERFRDRQAVQQAVDGADAERVAGRVDQEDQAVVPGAGGGVLRA
jgi:hypothetical protein